jgi:hypothetical protein
LVRHVWSEKPIHHHGPVMELLLRSSLVEQKHVFYAYYKKDGRFSKQIVWREHILHGRSIPGIHPNAGCFFIASMNASKSLGSLKVHALRLMSMLRLGLVGMAIGVDDRC